MIVTTFVANRAGFNRQGEPDNEAGNGWGFYDCGLHNENLVLKAKDMGLDTLIMGIRDEKAIRQVLNIPETEIIVAVIAVGYASEGAEKPKRKSTGRYSDNFLNIRQVETIFSQNRGFCERVVFFLPFFI